jgi:hypothetical protein
LHTIAPDVHAVVPGAHRPSIPVLQLIPPPGLPSSMPPLQSLSSPSQTSGEGFTLRLHAIDPAAHAVVPALQTPDMPVEQLVPPPGFPLSTTPSQSLSTPSQTSGRGFVLRLQATAPDVQDVVPAVHAPNMPVLHIAPPPGLPLSATPSQSLSSPSHTSAIGLLLRLQTIAPELQAVVPAEQLPGCPVLHITPPPGFPLSTTVSQSLSRPSHVSATGARGLQV